MKKVMLFVFMLLLLAGCSLKKELDKNISHMNTELIIAFKEGISDNEKQSILNKINASMINDSGSTVIVDANEKMENGLDVCTFLKQSDEVVDCTFNFTEEVVATPYENFE